MSQQRLIGVISDTHGLLRPEVGDVFGGVDLILHAGDIGAPQVLEQLRSIAPVVAVRGNNDKDEWAREIPETQIAEVDSVLIYILHNLKEIDLSPAAAGFRVVVSGHSHQPLIEQRAGVLFINPGSAGPRRFKLPITVAQLKIEAKDVSGEIIKLA